MNRISGLIQCRWMSFITVSGLFGGLLLVSDSCIQAEDKVASGQTAEGEPKKYAKSPITISPETTVIDGPLSQYGYVDYIAALNQQLSIGVTPENNSAVLFLQITGPHEVGQNTAEYCRMLGIPELPSDGQYMVSADRFEVPPENAETSQLRLTEHDLAMKGPWTAEQIPALARWLDQQSSHFDQIEQATLRSRYYTPLISGNPPAVVAVLLPQAQTSRTVARSLCIRSMFRLGKGDVPGAWQDILSMYRLARLVGQGPTLIEGLVGVAIDAMADIATIHLIQSKHLTLEQAAKIQDDLDALKPVCVMADKIDTAERYMFLDTVGLMLREGPGGWSELLGGEAEPALTKMLGQVAMQSIDADETMRVGNRWYNKLVANMRLATYQERRAAFALNEEELKVIRGNSTGVTATLTLLAGSNKGRGEMFGEMLVTMLVPAIQQVDVAAERSLVRRDQTRIALALRMFQMETGLFPATLSRLAPRYLPEVPLDRFSLQPIQYASEGMSCKFSSVGKNGKDDSDLDQPPEATSDDLLVELKLDAEK